MLHLSTRKSCSNNRVQPFPSRHSAPRRHHITTCPRWTSSPILQNLIFGTHSHPFFVFGQREVALFELPKFAGFSRQTSRFQQFDVFGRFRTILLCCEHETIPFTPRRELYRSLSHRRCF